MSSSASRKAARKAAMNRFKNHRRNGLRALDDDAGMFREEEDVYDVVDQDEYRNLVESRRQREDFVVDDDGLGYYDDGEERLGDEDRLPSAARKRGSNADLTARSLKKMRKNRASRQRNGNGNGNGNGNSGNRWEDGEDDADTAATARNRSMWEFVGVGGSAAAAAAAAGSSSSSSNNNNNTNTGTSNKADNTSSAPRSRPDLDALLGELDGAGAGARPLPQRRTKSHYGKRPAASRPRFRRRRFEEDEEDNLDRETTNANTSAHSTDEPDDYGASGFGEDEDEADHGVDTKMMTTTTTTTTTTADRSLVKAKPTAENEETESAAGIQTTSSNEDTTMRPAADDDDDDNEKQASNNNDESTTPEASNNSNHDAESSPPANDSPAKRRLVMAPPRRNKLGQRSAPAQRAAEQQKERDRAKVSKPKPAAAATKATASTTTTAPLLDTTSSSFAPQEIAAEPAGTVAASSNLEFYVQHESGDGDGDGDEEPKRFVDFYYLDAAERRNGDMHLFGKVAVPDDSNNSNNNSSNNPNNKNPNRTKFVSCCAVVKGNLRNLFVLPRKIPIEERTEDDGEDNEDDNNNNNNNNNEYCGWDKVHQELKGIIQPSCIPKVAGASWAGKVVQRKYAFDDPEVPRDTTSYMKVVYDAKYPAPDPEICAKGGQYVAKILNGRATTLETFLLKRGLMGPGWIRISEPSPSERSVSWCALELQVSSPKQVVARQSKSNSNSPPRPPPPVVAVTIKLKTVLNPRTSKNEIVSVSAVCHKRVLLDTGTDAAPELMTQISLIRPMHHEDHNTNTNTIQRGMAKFPRDLDKEIASKMPQLKPMPNERALLSCLVTQIGNWDPDVLVGHHAWGHDIPVLLSRCVEHKVRMWSKLGRHRQTDLPSKTHFSSGKDWAIAQALSGRLLCDTYLSAQEHLSETTYSLTNLSKTQLKTDRFDIEPMDTPQYFARSETIVALARHTLHDAQLVQRLLFKLQVLPLSKQLTNIAGNLWSQTLKSNRAGRTEYLLLHEFHRLKYLVPEKKTKQEQTGSGKAKYAGGLVLDPKKGLYDTFILLLDFNSLYPSLIQEYNLCFTTVDDWATVHKQQMAAAAANAEQAALPPLPDESQETGVLARVIRNLVQRRRQVKGMMKKESNSEKYDELDIKQKAFKLTANSMYGCLGFSNSRFYAQPIAALVTSMGRQTLQRTVEIAQSTVGLEVIYGDTDSIMINTRISDTNGLATVRKLGEQVKREVNKLYKTLELEIDGVFRTMLLLKKKKYAAVTIEQDRNGEIKLGREEKGLDLVRRDWCVQSKDTGHYVLDQILSTQQEKDVTISKILDNLEQLAQTMRAGQLPLEKYVITKGLSKHPKDYPDGKALPHVHVAKMMIKNNRRLTVGDHIPYVICEPLESDEAKNDTTKKASKSAAERARHPDEIVRSNGALKPDIEWYLTQQILPPVSRLCEPIEGLSQGLIAERLGLNASKYTKHRSFVDGEMNDDDLVNYVPESFKKDEERFADVEKLTLTCAACKETSEFPGLLYMRKGSEKDSGTLGVGFQCVNPNCHRPQYWGQSTPFECLAKIMNSVELLKRKCRDAYYDGCVKCDDPACGLETRQLSVNGGVCLSRGCNGRMVPKISERILQTQLKYFECLFDVDHVTKQLVDSKQNFGSNEKELAKMISKTDKKIAAELLAVAKEQTNECAYNWIAPSFWQQVFGGIQTKQ